jgi:hypothetical protein
MLQLFRRYTFYNSSLNSLSHLNSFLNPLQPDYVIGVGAGGSGLRNSVKAIPGGTGAVSIVFLGEFHSTIPLYYCCNCPSLWCESLPPDPARNPTGQPTGQPSSRPSSRPSGRPTRKPVLRPTAKPTDEPFIHTNIESNS